MRLRFFIPVILFVLGACCSTNRAHKKSGSELNSQARHDIAKLRVLSAVGMRQALLDLVPAFEKGKGYKVEVSFNSSGEIIKMIDSGDYDIVIIFRPNLENLFAAEKLVPGSKADLAIASVAVAVRKGAPKPDISSREAFKRAMLSAKTIACPDPARAGASGLHIASIFERLGIVDSVKSKLVLSSTPGNEKTMPGYLVAEGKAEIALHQLQELMAVPDIDIVGPLPGDLQANFVFAAAVTKSSKQVDIAKTFIRFLTARESKAIIKSKGMKPADD